uniref:Uncharacterized protein n=1 Tax=Heterorhabditis bacteriophora TaxID=37862 RepID=A0A1I7WEW2_HETBA
MNNIRIRNVQCCYNTSRKVLKKKKQNSRKKIQNKTEDRIVKKKKYGQISNPIVYEMYLNICLLIIKICIIISNKNCPEKNTKLRL